MEQSAPYGNANTAKTGLQRCAMCVGKNQLTLRTCVQCLNQGSKRWSLALEAACATLVPEFFLASRAQAYLVSYAAGYDLQRKKAASHPEISVFK
eukprot:36707-Rhodomonas_salina.1